MNDIALNTQEALASPILHTRDVIWRPASAIAIPASHAKCFACGDQGSLGLRFHRIDNGVLARLRLQPDWQGYAGLLHGGLIATLLDAAMTHCLFHHGIEGLTADLQVRYLDVVPCTGAVDLSARLNGQRKRIYELSAELSVAGVVKARAHARFMRHPGHQNKSCTAGRAPSPQTQPPSRKPMNAHGGLPCPEFAHDTSSPSCPSFRADYSPPD